MIPIEAVAAMMLFCAGNPFPGAQVEQGTVAVLKIPVDETMRQQLQSEPPVSKLKFIGEPEGQREWVVQGRSDPRAGKLSLLRLYRSNDPLSPFAFKAGDATKQDDGSFAFVALAQGKCDLRPLSTQSKGHQE